MDNPTGSELPYLEAFRAVCLHGGFTTAARALGRTQPAVSYQIRKLEQVFGVPLIERHPRALVLTSEGRRLAVFAERVFEELAQVRSECVEGRRLDPLRLGSASGFGRYVLVPALQSLRTERGADGLEVRLQYESADVLLDWLEEGAYEAAFVYKRRITSALEWEAAYDEELVLVGSPARVMELRERGTSALPALEAIPFVTYEECDYVFGRWFEAAFGAQPARLTSASHFTELEEVLAFAGAGAGLSIVPRDAAEPACVRGDVEVVYAGTGRPCLNTVFAVRRAGSMARPLLDRLVELVRARGASAAPRGGGA